jgi:hypothetical protein
MYDQPDGSLHSKETYHTATFYGYPLHACTNYRYKLQLQLLAHVSNFAPVQGPCSSANRSLGKRHQLKRRSIRKSSSGRSFLSYHRWYKQSLHEAK